MTRKGGDHGTYSGQPGKCPRCAGPGSGGERKFGGVHFISSILDGYLANLDGQGPDWLLRICDVCKHHWAEELPDHAVSPGTAARPR